MHPNTPRAPAPAFKIDIDDPQRALKFALSVGMTDKQAGALLRPTPEEHAAALAAIDQELQRRGVIADF